MVVIWLALPAPVATNSSLNAAEYLQSMADNIYSWTWDFTRLIRCFGSDTGPADGRQSRIVTILVLDIGPLLG
jgi:hypothetical protein